MRVAAGAVARKVLGDSISIRGAVTQIGPHAIDRDHWDWSEISNNPFWSPDAKMAATWETFLDDTRKRGSSAGAVVEVVASGIPAGLGAPVIIGRHGVADEIQGQVKIRLGIGQAGQAA